MHIGPVARVLVKQAAQRTSDMQALGEMLSEHHVYDQERLQFLHSMSALTGAATAKEPTDQPVSTPVAAAGANATGWDPKVLQAVQERLAHYVGPMARILVQRAAQHTTSPGALYRHLAEHLSTAQEKSRFLRDSGISA
jgi:serine/threonine-protein kinase